MIHQPSGGAQGQATDIEIQAREILNLRKRLNQIYVEHTGQELEEIESASWSATPTCRQSRRATSGLVDQVVKSHPGPASGRVRRS